MADIISITKQLSIGTDGVTYFETTTTVFDNEESSVRTKRIGPIVFLESYYADNIEQRAQSMAVNAVSASQQKRLLNEIGTEMDAIATITGKSPLTVVRERYQDVLLASGWEINEGSGYVPLAFTINAQGNIRYSVNGAATKSADFYGSVIQLNNYPSNGTDTQFFQIETGRKYISLPNRQFTIRKPVQ